MVLSQADLSQLQQWTKDTDSFDKLLSFLLGKVSTDNIFFEHMSVPVAIVDATSDDTPITYVNPAFEALTGYNATELLGENLRILQNGDHDQSILDDVRQAVQDKHPLNATIRNYRKDGTQFWNQMSMVPVSDNRGQITHFISTHHDVTVARQQQLFTDIIEEAYAQFVENTQDGIALHAPDGTLLYANPAYEAMVGYTLEELQDIELDSIVHPDDNALKHNQVALAEQTVSHIQYRIKHKDGHYIWLETYSSPLVDDNGTLRYLLAISRDISEIKYRSDQQFKTLVENNPDMIQRLSRDGTLLYGNPAFARAMGIDTGDIIGKTNEDLGVPPHLLRAFAIARHAAFDTGREQTIEFDIDTGDGVLQVASRLIPEFDPQGNVETVLVISRDVTGEKQAQQALLDSEAQLRRAQNVARIGSWERNLVTGEVYWSDEFYRICGLDPATTTPSQALRKSLIHPDDRANTNAIIKQAIDEGIPYMVEKRLIRPDGTIRWVESRGEVIIDFYTGTPKVVGTFLDITERKEAETAHARSESLMNALLNTIPDLVFHLDKDGSYLDFHGDLNLLVDQDSNLTGKTIHDRLSKQLAAEVQDAIDKTLETGTLQRIEYDIESDSRILEARFVKSGDEEVIAVVRDVTEERNKEREIERRETMYLAMLSGMVEGVFLYDKEGAIVMCNDAAVKITGISREQLLQPRSDRPSLNPFDENRTPFTPENFPSAKTLKTGEAQIGVIMGYFHPVHGDLSWIKTNTRPLFDSHTNMVDGCVTTFMDVTDEQQAQQERLNAAIERERTNVLNSFIQMSSHEFRTPLSIISTNLHLLQRTSDKEKQQHRIERVNEQITRIDNLIEMQLLMSKLDSGVQMRMQTVNLGLVVSQLLLAFNKKIEDKGLTLETDIEPHNIRVNADIDYLNQALYELVDNAVKYTASGGTITIHARETDKHVITNIIDTGMGISQEDQPFIFDRFWRRDKAHTYAGFGLGLAVAKQIANKHEAEIDVTSAVDEGTTITLRFPRPQKP